MHRLLLVVLLVLSGGLSSASHAANGRTVPICPTTSSPDCVYPNWGETGPDGVDSGMAPQRGDPLAAARTSGPRMSLQLMPVAASGNRAPPSDAPLKTVISPINLFPKETAALTSAIKQARFNPDGSIASGAERIMAAAAEAMRAAGKRYSLTLYIKVPQRLKPEDSGLLGKKVESINDLLMKPAGGATMVKPQS